MTTELKENENQTGTQEPEVLEKTLTPEQQDVSDEQRKKVEELVAKLAKEGKKIIPLPEVPQELRNELGNSINDLARLKKEIEEKRQHVFDQIEKIQNLAQTLIASDKISINKAELKQSGESSKKYAELLSKIMNDVDHEINYYSQFLTDEHPQHIVVWKEEPPHGIWFLMLKIKWIKKYIKAIRKDLQVSFSRYSFGFDNQLKKLEQAQMFLTHMKAHAS